MDMAGMQLLRSWDAARDTAVDRAGDMAGGMTRDSAGTWQGQRRFEIAAGNAAATWRGHGRDRA